MKVIEDIDEGCIRRVLKGQRTNRKVYKIFV